MIRKVLGVATAAMVLSLGAAHVDAKAATCSCILNIDDTTDAQYVSYEALPTTGVNVNEKYAVFSNGTTCSEKFAEIEKNSTMTITLNNASFENYGDVALLVSFFDSSTNSTEEAVVKPTQTAPDRVDFKFSQGNVFYTSNGTEVDFANVSGNFTVLKLTEFDGVTAKNDLWIKIPGTLQVGDRAQIVVTSVDPNGKHVENGCVKKDFIIVENQYTAKKPSIDEEGLAVVIENDKAGVLKLYDDEVSDQPLDYALYNPCEPPACSSSTTSTTSTTCCSTVSGDCELFCNQTVVTTTTTTTTTTEICADPGFCGDGTDPCTCTDNAPAAALEIMQNTDMKNAIVRATSLADSTVTLTLKGDMRGVSKVEFVAPRFDASGNATSYDVLCTATPDENGVASCQVSGRTLFQEFYRNPKTKSIDVSFKVYVDGQTQLAPSSFYASAEISGGQLYKAAKLDWGEVMTWGQGSKAPASFKVPYVRTDSLIATAIRIENTGSDTPLILFVSDPNGGWKFIKALPLKAGEELIIRGQDIVDWAKEVGLDLMATKEGRFAVLGVTGMSPCETASCTVNGDCPAIENAIDQFKDLNIYVAQQVIGTSNVRFVPVELVPGTPDNLHF